MSTASRLRTVNANIRGGVATVLGLYVFDALYIPQFFITFVVGWVMVVLGAVDLIRGYGSARGRRGLVTMAAYAALDLAVIGTIRANNSLARHRADRIVVALDQYKSDHGRYPERLDQLVPRYLATIPLATYTLAFNRFHYSSEDGVDGNLYYVAIAPFGRPYYDLRSRKWGSID